MVLLALPVLAAPVVSSFDAPRGALDSHVAEDGASLVLLYSGEQHGEIGPCGCDASPKGGLGRLLTVMQAQQKAEPDTPLVVVNPGAWLSSRLGVGALSDWAIRDNAWFQKALDLVPYDALLVTARDLPSVSPRPGLVSASHRVPGNIVQPYTVQPYTVVERGGLRIVITGVSTDELTYLQPPGTEVRPPVEAIKELLPELQPSDIVVVLVYDLPREAMAIAELPGVDIVIDAASYTERWPPRAVGDAVWVRSRGEGAAAGELRLWIEEGQVVRATDRVVRLTEDVPSHPRIDRLERRQDKGEEVSSRADDR